MYKRLIRMASGVFAVIFAAAPMSATAVTTSTVTPSMSTIHGKPASRIVKIGKKSASFPLPVGCETNGVHSFIGELGPIGKYVETNFAGAITSFPPSGYAGVLAGVNNEACDYLSAIGAGSENVIGGSGAAQRAFIGAGQQNAIDGAPYAFIGGGSANLVNGENVDGGGCLPMGQLLAPVRTIRL